MDISFKLAEILCQKKNSYLMDADLILPKYYNQILDRSKRYSYKFFIAHVVCNEETILQRIKNRQNNPNSLSRGDIKMYWQRKKIHAEQKLPKNIIYTINTSNDYEKQFQELVRKIKLKIK